MARGSPSERVFLNSIPKTGAHLVTKALEILGYRRGAKPLGSSALLCRTWWKRRTRSAIDGRNVIMLGIELPVPVREGWLRWHLAGVRPGRYGRGHVRHSEAFAWLLSDLGLSTIHLVRDPRDVAVSHAHYCTRHQGHLFHKHYVALGTWERRLAFSITGGPVPGVGYLDSLAARFRAMEPWLHEPGVLHLTFEDLVGAEGGGAVETQRSAFAALATHLSVEPTAEVLDDLTENLFGGTSTFRNGQIGNWRDELGPEHRDLLEATAPGLAEAWGYPPL